MSKSPVLLVRASTRLLCGMTLLVAGCGENPLDVATEARLQAIVSGYLDFAVAKGIGPTNHQELQQSLRDLAPFKIPATDESTEDNSHLLISPRDGKPFVLCYGLGVSQAKGTAAPAMPMKPTARQGTTMWRLPTAKCC